MKTLFYPLSFLLIFFCILPYFSNAQDTEVVDIKNYKDFNIGECNLLKSYLEKTENVVYKVFEIEVNHSGLYYLRIFGLPLLEKGNLKKIKVSLNHKEESTGEIAFSNSGFQAAFLSEVNQKKDKTISLTKGKHKIYFSHKSSETPIIDGITISKTKSLQDAKEENALNYIHQLKSNRLPNDYLEQKNRAAQERQLPNPEGNYQHEIEVNFNYTTVYVEWLTAGTWVTYETKNSNTDPILYVFHHDYPVLYSISNDDTNGLESKLTFYVGYTGFYVILLRAYNSSYPGASDLWKNGSLFAGGSLVAGVSFTIPPKTGSVNFFTSHITRDTRLFASYHHTGPIKAHNDDWLGSSDFYWGTASRIKGNFDSSPIQKVFLSAYSILAYGCVCDVYMNCGDSDIYLDNGTSDGSPVFPNLKAEDAIQSAPENNNYNCLAWAGGITTNWMWPYESAFSPWDVPGNPLQSFDNFLGNTPPRYTGAYNYTRNGATLNNSVIDLWGAYQFNGLEYKHFSVRKPGNNQPHGYDWESKPGGSMRTFHPRNALKNTALFAGAAMGYGDVVAYYRWDGTLSQKSTSNLKMTKGITLEESLKAGLSVLDKVEFSKDEGVLLDSLAVEIPMSVKDNFERLFQKWQKTWNQPHLRIHSNPTLYTYSKEYKELLNFCKREGKETWLLLTKKYKKPDIRLLKLLEEVTLEHEVNRNLLKRIMDNNIKQQYDSSGKYIVRSEVSNGTQYLKDLLQLIYLEKSGEKILNTLRIYPNPASYFKDITIAFQNESLENAELRIYGALGQLLYQKKINLRKGQNEIKLIDYLTKIDSGFLEPGYYFIQLKNQSKVYTRRILLQH